jgi:hypothetical protein
MIVDLDENELRLEHRKTMIPIGFAELDKLHDDVLIPNVSVDQLCRLPTIKEIRWPLNLKEVLHQYLAEK